MSNKPRLIAAVAMAALLGACATVGPSFTAPAAPATAGYAMSGDAVAKGLTLSPEARTAGPWWTALGSPDLDRVIRQAFADSPSVAEAGGAIARAQADVATVRGVQGFQADATAGAARERINIQAFGLSSFGGMAISNPTINLYTVGGAVTYDLDLFGGQRRAREDARARLEAQMRRADAAYLSLSGQIAIQAAKIAGYRAEIEAVGGVIASDQSQIEMIRKAERAGGAAPSEARVGETQLAQDQALLGPLEHDLEVARHQLALLVGKAPADWTPPDFTLASFTSPTALPVSLPSSLVRQRPDILAAEADLHAATARIGVATAELYPDIRLSAGLTQSALRPGNLFSYDSSGWNFGPSVRLPLFDRAGKGRRDAAVADARVSLARYQGTVLRAFLQVADALSSLAQDNNELDALGRAEAAASSSAKDARTAYNLGGGNLLSVIDAQRQLSQIRRQIARVEARRLEDLIEFYTATGANWRTAA